MPTSGMAIGPMRASPPSSFARRSASSVSATAKIVAQFGGTPPAFISGVSSRIPATPLSPTLRIRYVWPEAPGISVTVCPNTAS